MLKTLTYLALTLFLAPSLIGGEYTKQELRVKQIRPLLLTAGLPKNFIDAKPEVIKGMHMMLAYGYSDNDEDTVTEYWLTQTKLAFDVAKTNVRTWAKRNQFSLIGEECYESPRLYCEWQFRATAHSAVHAILATDPQKSSLVLMELRSFRDKTLEEMQQPR